MWREVWPHEPDRLPMRLKTKASAAYRPSEQQ